MLIQTLKNTRQGSHKGNQCGGFCIAAVEHPSPGSFSMEIWKDIKGYEGLYVVSNTGKIKSIDRYITDKNGKIKFTHGRIIKVRSQNSGYNVLRLCKNGKKPAFTVHRIVAETFIPNPENKPYTNHKDGNKQNNRVSNLEWVTPSENMRHAVDTGLWKYPGKTKDGRRRLSESMTKRMKGVPKTEEHNLKNSIAQKKRWAKIKSKYK